MSVLVTTMVTGIRETVAGWGFVTMLRQPIVWDAGRVELDMLDGFLLVRLYLLNLVF